MKGLVIVVAGSLVLGACGETEERPDPTELPESAEPTAQAFIAGGRIAAAIGVPLSESGNEIDTDAGEDDAKGKIEDGLGSEGGDQPAALTNPDCVSLAWQGLTVTVTYAACLDDDGTMIDGGLSLGLTLIPLRFEIAFDQLAIDATTYDGSLGIAFAGEMGNRTTTIDADLSIADAAASKSVQLAGFSLQVTETQVVLAGAGGFTDAQNDVTFDATAVTVASGDCLPTSGDVAYDDGTFDVVITFLPTTPTTGEVTVTAGAFQTTVALLPACQ